MKTGKTLVELAQEIERQRETRKDYIGAENNLGLAVVDNQADGGRKLIAMTGLPEQAGVNPLAHSQIAAHTNVPKAYYDRMLEKAPHLASRFRAHPPAVRVRSGVDIYLMRR